MQTKIFVSRSREDRDEKIWKELERLEIFKTNPDILVFEDEKFGIAQVKQLIKHLSTKPFGNTLKSAVIIDANNISLDAQNALLKTLEEPPGESVIFIGVDAENKLLPTVLSRCEIINLEFKVPSSDFDLQKLLDASPEERFQIIEKTEDKEKFLNDLTNSYREGIKNSNLKLGFLEELLQAEIWKEANVNIRTILEYLMLKL